MAKGTEEFPLKILLLGPPGNGKSTVAVQILYKWGALEPQVMQTLQKQMEEKNLTPAQLLESLQRSQAPPPERHYESPKYEVSITSYPGCCFAPHASHAACVLLLVSAAQLDFGNYWRLFKKLLAFACKLPVQLFVVLVNKMDATRTPYSGQKYKDVVRKISARFRHLGRSPDNVVFLPISAICGDNMEGTSVRMPWFRGWEIKEEAGGTLRGMTLRQLLDGIFLIHKLDSYSKPGVWSPQEEKSLLSVWKALATPALNNPACPHSLSLALMCTGVRRSPEQCRSKANSLLNCYIAARLRRRRHPSFSPKELQDILDCEAAQVELQREKLRLQGQTQALEEEEKPAVLGPSCLWELFLAGEASGEEKGPGICSERLKGKPERREGLPALPKCLRLPRGQRDQDPDYVLTGLEIKPCRRVAQPIGGPPGAAKAAFVEGYRCVVNRLANFAVKQKQTERAMGARPLLPNPKPLLAVPPLPPLMAPSPPVPPTTEVDQLVLFPLPPPAPLRLPLLPVDGPMLATPTVSAMLSLPATPPSLCCAPSALAYSLPWQNQEVLFNAPLQPVEHWPSPCFWDPAPEADESPWAQLDLPAVAAAVATATWFTSGSPEPDLLVPPAEDSGVLPFADVGPESPSSGTSMSPLQYQAPQESGLGLSATALLSSLALLESEKDVEVACPPGTLLQPLSPPLSADSGAPPSPQLQGLLSCRLPSPSCLDLSLGDS